jgi:hypothetical protein
VTRALLVVQISRAAKLERIAVKGAFMANVS